MGPSSAPTSVLVVGAGHAGTATAVALRQYGFAGHVTVLGAEAEHPYHRPPVSKAYLSDDAQPELLKGPTWFQDNDVDLRLGRRVTSVDHGSGRAVLDDGDVLSFDTLVLATGARARAIPLSLPRAGCWTLRTFREAVAFRQVLRNGARIVIVGGGFIGLEVAAAARRSGCAVTVVEREARLLQRIASPVLSQAVTRYHRDQGVEIMLEASVTEIVEGADGSARAVRLADGTELECDAVVIGVGADPRDDLAREVGADCDGGVLVDGGARTSVPGVYAVGDVTRREVAGYDGRFRLESIPNAGEQAKQAAAAIVGAPPPRPEVPWFWSDQYDLKVKIAGLLVGANHHVVRGDPDAGQFAIYHLDAQQRLVAVEAVNSAGDFMAGKKWIASRATPSVDLLPDSTVPLRELVPA
ncbi:NAD(P)/FAD-dependent oxidoreductase [Georgenia sp. SYP-B2076]|uniref:NAD(P)/FAD-dependent oxidoreductase n=1 Tax=Georgenia sp. SYP-B2076 TaxID=2495881 RepID=UPI0013DEAFBA|nr:FAD-dependent oxidoreductase [Georgenia sp. SYP-B2076]